jgi:hypothetical protein
MNAWPFLQKVSHSLWTMLGLARQLCSHFGVRTMAKHIQPDPSRDAATRRLETFFSHQTSDGGTVVVTFSTQVDKSKVEAALRDALAQLRATKLNKAA